MDETYEQDQTYRPALRRPIRPIPQEDEERKERISKTMAAMLVVTALSIDLFEGLLNLVGIGEVVSTIISACADLGFMIWFWTLGLSFVKSPKKFAAMGIQAVVGLVPVLNTLPELTLGILAVVLITRSEDKGGLIGKVANTVTSVIPNK